MEKYPSELRARLMENETSIRTVIDSPKAGRIVTLGFPGLAFDVQGNSYIDRERLDATLDACAVGGTRILIVLVEREEVPGEAWTLLEAAAQKHSIRLVHMPIADYEAPDALFDAEWSELDNDLSAVLNAGGAIALCCHYGAGRSGTVAAGMLIERGLSAASAIKTVRGGFADSIESEKQLLWLQRKEKTVAH